jgi:hypothetical protein
MAQKHLNPVDSVTDPDPQHWFMDRDRVCDDRKSVCADRDSVCGDRDSGCGDGDDVSCDALMSVITIYPMCPPIALACSPPG